MSNPALKLVKEIGFFNLSGTDGCLCASCEVQGVHISVSCRKSDGAMEGVDPDFYGTKLRVWCDSLDADGRALRAVADEVTRQIREHDGNAVRVRYCDYDHDRNRKCVYCGALREPQAYLCAACMTKEPFPGFRVADQYDYTSLDFCIPAEND